MLGSSEAFSGYTVNDIEAAKVFYESILGIEVSQDSMGLQLKLPRRSPVFIYHKENHQPATYTVLNFPVEDIDTVIDELVARGVVLERYENLPMTQDERGVLRGKASNYGPDIAWLKDPAGNILSLLSS